MLLTRRYQLLLLSAVTLTVFYPTVFAEVSFIDDVHMVNDYRQRDNWRLKDVFLPRTGNGIYYRPFINISFLIDKYLTGLDSGFMHLHNIFLHLINAMLVYYISSQIMPGRTGNTYLPLIAALFFAVHPINTESVNWISGRTDVLMSAFILLSFVLLVKFKGSHRRTYLVTAIAMFLFGILTKEVALAFLPGFLFILSARENIEDKSGITINRRNHFRKYFFVFLTCIAVGLFAILLRNFAFTSNYSMIGMTVRFMANDWTHTLFVFLRAFGFYIKKLFMPYPLNFAILQVDPLYELLAILLVLICIYIASRNTITSAMFTAGAFLITPSFVIAFNQIAWTPYAERYLYLPSAFIITSVLFYLHKNFTKKFISKATLFVIDPKTPPFKSPLIKGGLRGVFSQKTLGARLSMSPYVVSGETSGMTDKVLRVLTYDLISLFSNSTFRRIFVIFLLAGMAVSSINRNITWQTNLALLKDTAEKSPGSKDVKLLYGNHLALKGDYKNAIQQLKEASSIYSLGYDERPDLDLGEVYLMQGNIDEAISITETAFQKSKGKSKRALETLISLSDKKASNSMDANEKIALNKKIGGYREKLLELKSTTHKKKGGS